MGTAYTRFAEEDQGSIEAGKLAGLVVSSDDNMTVPDDEIQNIEALTTILDGGVVYERE